MVENMDRYIRQGWENILKNYREIDSRVEETEISDISDCITELQTVPKPPQLTTYFNQIYETKGFDGVIESVEIRLRYGMVQEKENGLFCITTGGWYDDEQLLYSLTHVFSRFGNAHFVGELRGGAYYFCREKDDFNFEIINILK